jgi:hypothetical protein
MARGEVIDADLIELGAEADLHLAHHVAGRPPRPVSRPASSGASM